MSLWVIVAWIAGNLLSAGPVAAETADALVAQRHVMLRQRVEPEGAVFVGQPVRVWVEVLTRTWFLEAPRFPMTIEVARAIVLPPRAMGVNSSERIGGNSYAVQGKAFTIFPQTVGSFEVPAFEVTLVVAQEDASRSPPITLSTEPLVVEARLPEGTEAEGLVLSTPHLTLQQEYDRPTEGLKVGESLRRQVTMTIEDAPAMLLSPLEFEVGPGVAVYAKRPELDDQRERGRMQGTRVDAVTYALEAEGTFELPEIVIPWWNLSASRLEHEVLPAVTFTVGPNPDLAAEHFGEAAEEEDAVIAAEVENEKSRFDWRWLPGAVLVLGLLAYLARSVPGRIAGAIAGRANSEAGYFRRFREAAAAGDPRRAHEMLMRWLDRLSPEETVTTLRALTTHANDPELTHEVEVLERRLFGRETDKSADWSGERLARAVGRARKRLLRAAAPVASERIGLPSLNP